VEKDCGGEGAVECGCCTTAAGLVSRSDPRVHISTCLMACASIKTLCTGAETIYKSSFWRVTSDNRARHVHSKSLSTATGL
jgi:hypothetical protein